MAPCERMYSSAIASRSQVEIPGRTCFLSSSSTPNTMRPAARIVSISVRDLRMIICSAADDGLHAVGHLVHGADGIDGGDGAVRPVPVEHRGRLLPVGLEAHGDGGGVIVGAVLHAPALPEARQELGVGHVEEEHDVHLPAKSL